MLKTLESKIKYRISRSKDSVFILKDFDDLSGYDQIGRTLRALEKKGEIAKISRGMYAKVMVSPFKADLILVKPLTMLAREGLIKLGITVVTSKAATDYNSGQSTQVPTGRRIAVKGRVSREIKFNKQKVYLENAS
ncbi:hypothetical protein LCGC14_0700500 [marine sediment metagenome]|uniref:S-adenosylhomocysteine hydrolase n=1 Tax=marine sediment metagenome TaxID=412755 RepID=A0A0F9QML8_9ZZZZ